MEALLIPGGWWLLFISPLIYKDVVKWRLYWFPQDSGLSIS
jgi:hypothetical protein